MYRPYLQDFDLLFPVLGFSEKRFSSVFQTYSTADCLMSRFFVEPKISVQV